MTYPVDHRGYTATPGAAKYVDLSESQVRKLRLADDGPEFVKFGKSVRYSFAALDAWAASQRRTSTKEPEAA